MKHVQYSRYHGGSKALEYVEVPIPKPKAGELLLKVEAISNNPVELRIQDGLMKHFLPLRFPFAPGTDVAGEVVSLGTGVKGFRPGDKVVAHIHVLKGGGYAEYAIASSSRVVLRVPEISASEAASIVVAGYTALQSARQVGIKSLAGGCEHLNVQIIGASGGVGTILLQLVKLSGAHVTVTCSDRNIELMRNLKADEVLDYQTQQGATYTSPSGRRYHRVFNCAHFVPLSNFSAQLQPNARVIDLTPTRRSIVVAMVNKVSLRSPHRFENFYMWDNQEDLQTMMELMGAGKVKAVLDTTFPLCKAGDAWDHCLKRRCAGKIILCSSPPISS
ncbi:chloroplast envelope quinone oxidoreductase homolog [Physcomitrium patens]|uniref:Enoyl reductase (ER) domain-containing protein n=1 Tax=Physcomitrium patens TaxID=3218 RepID=A0A7I4F2L8_PHYPA